jgi:3-oxocholest-4-en-26-oyl-CoA dehydrogenase alpha subunit
MICMDLELTPRQHALRQEIRAYFAQLMTPDLREALRIAEAGPLYRQIIRRMGRDGYLCVGWPLEHGGRGYSALEQLIFLEESQRAGAPYPFVTVNTVGPTLMAHGSDMQKARFLPGIAAGEILFAIGYTESQAGTDLASLTSCAVRDGDDFIVDGAKVFTSGAEGADYIWLAVRTDQQAPRHHGISILIVDTRLPGFSYTPLDTVGGLRTSMTYYENIRVPGDMLVGALNGGWKVITAQLNHERVGLAARGAIGEDLFERVLAWARNPDTAGRRPVDDPTVQFRLAEVHARLEVLRLMNYRLAWSMVEAAPDPAFAAAAKVHGSETMIEVCRGLLEVLGIGGLIRHGGAAALITGDVEAYYRRCQINTFGGGTAEVMRELVAQFALGLPRTRR